MKLISFIFALLAIFSLSALNLNALRKFNKRYFKVAMNADSETPEQPTEVVPTTKEEVETIPAGEEAIPEVAPAPMEEIEKETVEERPEVAPAPTEEMETIKPAEEIEEESVEEEEIPESYLY